MAAQFRNVETCGIRQSDADDVVRRPLGRETGSDFENFFRIAHDALGQDKAGRQLAVVAGSAHHDGNRVSFDPNLEWFLNGHLVPLPASALSCLQPNDLCGFGGGARFHSQPGY